MVLAVVDHHADVLHGIAGERTRGEHLADALLDGRHELSRNDAALRLIDELEAGTALERLDPEEHFTELPRAAGLLLVARVPLGRNGNRFAIRDAWRARFDLDVVDLREPVEHGAQVQLPEAANHGLVR